jgi:hypothetical protein
MSHAIALERERFTHDSWHAVTISWSGGASRDRTDDLRVANATLSQLSYGPFRFDLRKQLVSTRNPRD